MISPSSKHTSRLVVLSDSLNPRSSGQAVGQLFAVSADSGESPILVINSAGGRIIDALAVYDAMNSLPQGVVTIGAGVVASMAVLLLAAGQHRFILPHTTIHVHQPFGRTEIEGTKLEETLNEERRLSLQVNDLIKEHTQGGADFSSLSESGLLISPEDAIQKYQLADKVLTSGDWDNMFAGKS